MHGKREKRKEKKKEKKEKNNPSTKQEKEKEVGKKERAYEANVKKQMLRKMIRISKGKPKERKKHTPSLRQDRYAKRRGT